MVSSVDKLTPVLIGVFSMIVISSRVNAQQFRDTPPMYNMDNLPETRFTCEGKLTGRYYADADTDCQMFHVCAKMSRREVSDFRFLCPNGTVFDQENQVCADYYQVVCHSHNPLGQVFEIFKLSSKESTNQREFGHVPSRDPDYLGQNNLGGGEDFQAEEYNNNKLAASRNALFSNVPSKTSSKQDIFFQYSTQKTTTTTSTTLRPTRPPTVATTVSPTLYQTTRETYIQPQEVQKSTYSSQSPSPRPTSQPTRPETYVQNKQSQKFTYSSPSSSPRPAQSAKFVFSDFASLAKFQAQFHGLVTHAPRRPSSAPTTPSTPTERLTTASRFKEPVQEISDYETTTQLPTTYVTTFAPRRSNPTTTRRPEESQTLAPTTPDLNFNTRPRSETNPPPSHPTTHRTPLYQNTFRTTFTDLTTPSPQTFQQQPSRYDEEFFRKVVAQNELKTEIVGARNEELDSNSPTYEGSFSSTAKSIRGRRRRINPNNRRHKYSQRVENARFDDRESFAVREKTSNNKAEEIFDTEASIFPRPADINNFYNQEFRPTTYVKNTTNTQDKPEVLLSGGERDTFGRRLRTFKEGKRVRLEPNQQFASSPEPRIERRPIKRVRQRITTEADPSESYISPTTYRPSFPVQLRSGSSSVSIRTTEEIPTTTQSVNPTTTTEEPELVTASDEEIELIRKKNKFTSTTELSSVKVTPKSTKTSSTLSFKKIEKPIKKTNVEEESFTTSTRNPDYDYIYYDTDLDNDYAEAAKQSKYGNKKSTKVIIKS